MADHVAEQIIQAAKAALTGTSAGANVFDSRLYNLQDSELPALLVDQGDESSEIGGKGNAIELQRTLELLVIAVAKQTIDYRKRVNTLRKEVEQRLAAPAFGALCKYCVPKSLTLELDGEGEQPVARATMKFEVLYYTAANAPDVPH